MLGLALGVPRLAPLSTDFLCQSNREHSCEPEGHPAVSAPRRRYSRLWCCGRVYYKGECFLSKLHVCCRHALGTNSQTLSIQGFLGGSAYQHAGGTNQCVAAAREWQQVSHRKLYRESHTGVYKQNAL